MGTVVGSIVGGLIVVVLVGVLTKLPSRISKRIARWRGRGLPALAPGFPFDAVTSAREMAELAPNFPMEELDIAYQQRADEAGQAKLLRTLDNSPFLLIRGRTGLGKTREALELVRRLEQKYAGLLTILIPKSSLGMPPFEWPAGLESRHIVLYVDNLHERYFSPPREGERYSVVGDFRAWLQASVEHLLRRFPGSDLRVLAIVRDDVQDPVTGTKWDEKIGYSPRDRLWSRFTVCQLPDWATTGCRRALIDAVAAWRGIQVHDDAAVKLANKTDGTAGAIVAPLSKKSPEKPVSVEEVEAWPGTFEDQASRDWRDLIEPYQKRRVVFQAVSLLKQGGVTPYADVTVELAACLWGRPRFLRRRQLRRALGEMDTWIKLKGPVLDCHEDYYRDRLALPGYCGLVAKALRSLSRRYPERIAPQLGNLGVILRGLPLGDRADNLEEAIACYGRALEVRTREAYPEDWAMTQNNLGNAYSDRIKGERADNLEEAIACYGRALEVYTRKANPEKWATMQNNLGATYGNRIKGERADNVEEAIACYGRALEVRTREAYPEKWATTQNNLGNAYGNRIKGERADNLEEAIACYGRALEVYTRAAFPRECVIVQKNLGDVQRTLAEIRSH